jgi:hypothetical protein
MGLTVMNPRPDAARKFPVASATVIVIGDLLYYDGVDVHDADGYTWDTDEATTRKKFCGAFAGVALESSPSGKSDEILVSGPGAIVEMTCTSTTYEIGDRFGPEKDSGNTLDNDKLQKVTDEQEACAVAVEDDGGAAKTTVKAMLLPSAAAYGTPSPAAGRLYELTVPNYVDLGTANDPAITNHLCKCRSKLVQIEAVVKETVAADTTAPVISYLNGSNEGDDTLTIPDTTARGAIVTQAVSDANGYDYFDVDDQLDVKVKTAGVDSSSEAGEAYVILRFLAY